MNQMKNMGGLTKILSMMPGYGQAQMQADMEDAMDEKQMDRIEAIILSMTTEGAQRIRIS